MSLWAQEPGHEVVELSRTKDRERQVGGDQRLLAGDLVAVVEVRDVVDADNRDEHDVLDGGAFSRVDQRLGLSNVAKAGGGAVDHARDAVERLLEPGTGGQVADGVGVAGPPAEHPDVMAALSEPGDGGPAERPGAAGDEDAHQRRRNWIWSSIRGSSADLSSGVRRRGLPVVASTMTIEVAAIAHRTPSGE